MSNKLTIVKTDGNIGFVTDVEDGVSGFLANGVAVAGGVQLGVVYKIRSLADAVALKIDTDYDTTNSVLVYEHLKEAFRINANADIRLMLVDKTTSYEDMVDPAETDNAKKLLLSEAGAIKMLFVAYNPTVWVADYTDTLAAITMAQTLYASEAAAKRDIHIFLEGKGFTKTNATDFRALNAANVSVVNGQSLSVGVANATYAAIGLVMGVYSKIPVNQSGAWVAKNNLLGGSLVEAAIGGVNISTILDGAMAALEANGSIFFQRQIPVAGLYMNGSHVCHLKTSDYGWIELNRTINKAISIIRLVLTPALSGPIKVDPATGFMPAEAVMANQAAAKKALVDTMESTDEISGVSVTIDPFHNLIENPSRTVKFALVPVGVDREIVGEIGFASSI